MAINGLIATIRRSDIININNNDRSFVRSQTLLFTTVRRYFFDVINRLKYYVQGCGVGIMESQGFIVESELELEPESIF